MKDLFSPKIKNGIFCLLFLVINIQLFAQDSNISISRMVNDDNSIDLNYEKKLPGTYHVILEFSKVYNCDIKRYECDIKGHNGSLLTLRPSNSKSRTKTSTSLFFKASKTSAKSLLSPKVLISE